MHNLNLFMRQHLLGLRLTFSVRAREAVSGSTHLREVRLLNCFNSEHLTQCKALLDIQKAKVEPGTRERAKDLASSFSEGL